MNTNNGYGLVSLTDERMVIDLPLAGFKASNIKVSKVNAPSLKNVGRFIKIRATWEDLETADDKKAVAFEKVVNRNVKEDIEVREDFDIAKAKGSFVNGLLRIEIPKVVEAIGTAVDLG